MGPEKYQIILAVKYDINKQKSELITLVLNMFLGVFCLFVFNKDVALIHDHIKIKQ